MAVTVANGQVKFTAGTPLGTDGAWVANANTIGTNILQKFGEKQVGIFAELVFKFKKLFHPKIKINYVKKFFIYLKAHPCWANSHQVLLIYKDLSRKKLKH